MSTHYIEEAERLADTVTIMSHGKAVAAGPPSELVLEHAGQRGGRGLRAAGAARRGRGRGPRRGLAHAPHRHVGRDPRASSDGNGDLPEGERRAANLEDVFVLLTGEEIA